MGYEENRLYFEDLEVGQEFLTDARTITGGDIQMFAAISGDYRPQHLNQDYAGKTPAGERTAHDLLGVAIASGLRRPTIPFATMAFLGFKMEFKKPLRTGDTIYSRQSILEKRETKKDDRGIVRFKRELVNTKGEVIQEGEATLMVQRRK